MRRLLVVFALLAVACGTSTGAPNSSISADDTSPIQLSLRYRTGDQDTYVLREIFDGIVIDQFGHAEPATFDVRAEEVTRASAVASDGTATLEVELRAINETSSPVPPLPEGGDRYQLKLAPDGRVVGGGEAAIGGVAYTVAVAAQPFAILAGNPVAPGDSWSSDYQRNDLPGAAVEAVHADNHFERYELLDGIRVARVRTSLSMPVDREVDLGGHKLHEIGTVTARMTSEVDPVSGRFLETDTNVDFELTAGGYRLTGTQILLLNRRQ